MARKTTVMLQDDLDGSTGTTTIRFGFQGVEYEIDLNDENAAEMTHWLENYISHGRRVGGSKRSPKNGYASKADPKLVREWAAAQGIEISARGRIPSDIQERYIIFVGG
jgi:Lsr2